MANTTLDVVSLDRPTLRADLIRFLRGQAQFRDYDFTGSNLSVLIDLLAYNTNKQAFLTNMLFAEAFLDSAQLMSSVVSHAKELNYLPRSATSASTVVTVSFQSDGQNQPYVIPKGSSFSTLVKNTQYVFSMPESVVVSSANSSFSFTTRIHEGEYFKDGYVYAPSADDPFPSFKITNPNIDTSSLTVIVFEDDSVLGDTYTLATSLLGLTQLSKVYFLQATTDGFYEVLFGDGVIGRQPSIGSAVVLDYRVTVGDRANSASKFAINFDPTGIFSESTGVVIATPESSAGGAPAESIGSIKYYAPRWYETQERAVPAPDYKTLLTATFPEIGACTAYGGEDADPPLYGRIVISVSLTGLDRLPASKKDQYQKFLGVRMPLGMRLIFVDPLFTFIHVETLVRYDVSVTSNTPARITSLVTDKITTWNDEHLGDFASILRYSPFCTGIDSADPSIVSDTTRLLLYKKLNPVLQTTSNLSLDFQIPLVADLPTITYPHSSDRETVLTSTEFTYTGFPARLEDDSAGNINVVQDVSGVTSRVARVGSVDYGTGIVTLSMTFDGYSGESIRLYARARDADLSSDKNTILAIEPSGISITAVPLVIQR